LNLLYVPVGSLWQWRVTQTKGDGEGIGEGI